MDVPCYDVINFLQVVIILQVLDILAAVPVHRNRNRHELHQLLDLRLVLFHEHVVIPLGLIGMQTAVLV